ncbi:MAG: ankyrin repeat domain-containing protein [Bacteroidales bacterium]|nr:ankyrin repeat domain-containing protein [Bacteroidales bacterium]
MKRLSNLLFVFSLLLASNFSNAQHRSELHEPAGRGDLEAVKEKIENGAKVDKKDIAGQTPLMYAAEGGSIEVVKYLVEKGADVNAESGSKGRGTALIYAAAANRFEVVKYLLENGADINATTPYQNETALVWSVAMGHTDVVKLLVEKGADQEIKNRSGQTVMDLAKQSGKEDVVKILQGE